MGGERHDAPRAAQDGGKMTDEVKPYTPAFENYYKEGSFIDYATMSKAEAAVEKWCGKDLESLLRGYANGDEATMKAKLREAYELVGYPTQEEYDELHAIHRDMCQANGAMMNGEEYSLIEDMVNCGEISSEEGKRRILAAEKQALNDITTRVFKAIQQMNRLVYDLNQNRDVMLSDEEKAEAVARWEKRKAFEDAKREINDMASEMSKRGDHVGAAHLLRDYPEFW